MQNILVIFQAKQQETEGLALAFGLGAVQAGGNIRLRHLDPSPVAERAHSGYGVLKSDDIDWAEGTAVLIESAEFGGMKDFIGVLEFVGSAAQLNRKWVYLFYADSTSPSAFESKILVQSRLRNAGYQLLEDEHEIVITGEYMTRMGQKLASVGGN